MIIMRQNQHCFALLYEFEAHVICELMVAVEQKTKSNYVPLQGTRRYKWYKKGRHKEKEE